MQLADLLSLVNASPIVASVQASEGSPLEDPATLLRSAQASVNEGIKVLRLQGSANISVIRSALPGAAVIGLIKKRYSDSEVYITPSLAEIDELLRLGCEVIALDGTARTRPSGATLGSLIDRIHAADRLALADCDTYHSILYSIEAGADIVSTTLSGYTPDSLDQSGPDLGLVRDARTLAAPLFAEGRFTQPWQARAALRAGARAVVIGGALNDPVKQTRSFLRAAEPPVGPVGAVDIGGTWLRFGYFSENWELIEQDRIELPRTHAERLGWIEQRAKALGITKLGISSGGTVSPSGLVVEARDLIPDHSGQLLSLPDVEVVALNDGLATAWGHACHPAFAGMRVATLALGTGVGAGFVADHSLWMGTRGEYPRLNDLPADGRSSYEDLLGGAALTSSLSEPQRTKARWAAEQAIATLSALYLPEVIVLCGGVGLSDWLGLETDSHVTPNGWVSPKLVRSPFGPHAGLFGAAALALFPPFPSKGAA